MFKKSYQISFFFLLICALGVTALANNSADGVWQETDDTNLKSRPLERMVVPASYKAFRINAAALNSILEKAPMEFTEVARNTELILSFPMPDGTFQRFRITESPIVEPGLLVKFPELRTYSGQGIDDPSATARFDFINGAFHSQILSTKGTILVDPYFKSGDTENYISYRKDTVNRTDDFICHFKENKQFQSLLEVKETLPFGEPDAPSVISGATLRSYRLALAATGEYTTAVGGGTVAGGLAAQVVVMNRVNGVYEKDLTLRMVIIANNNLIVYTNGGTDPYTNNNGGTMLGQNQTNLDTVIGTANYDIGHVFSTGGGGVASLQSPCNAGTKAQGVTGLPSPLGDPFAIDFVAHEMGHQWGSNHTFNGTSGNCSGNRVNAFSFEPGSGITIMGYAGICANQDLAPNSIDTFHLRSLDVIVAFSQTGNGNTCDVETATGNTPPTITLTTPGPYNIPKQTPFSLTASATDVNGDSLTYDWQQVNAGTGGGTTAVPNTDSDNIARPLFRNYLPTTTGTRFFPSLQYILNNNNIPPATTGGFLTGELMSAMTRAMRFDVVVRDSRAGGGGVNSSSVTVNVDAVSGPFDVTAPNTAVTWAGNSTQTVTWNVAGTTAAPVSAANVKISFSTDGGQTFPTTILASTPNDGTQTITVPNVATTQGRIKVEGENNIFFDISNANFTVTAVVVAIRSRADFDGDGRTDLSVFRPSEGNWYLNRSTAGFAVLNFGISTDTLVPGDYDGDGKADTAVFRPDANSANPDFFVLNSNGFTVTGASWGIPSDIPISGDYNGDGRTDITVFRPSTATWYILNSGTGTNTIEPFGLTGDVPLSMDNNADGRTNLAVFRPSTNTWYIAKPTGTPATNFDAYPFGLAGDLLVPADYDNDNKDDVAVYRGGAWYILRSTNGIVDVKSWGTTGDVPVPGDYDGDGADDLAVYRSGTWYVNRSTAGSLTQAFGLGTDKAIPKQYIP